MARSAAHPVAPGSGLAAQIARTIAAKREGTAAQRRAVEATERALDVVADPPRPAGWQFTRSGAEVSEASPYRGRLIGPADVARLVGCRPPRL